MGAASAKRFAPVVVGLDPGYTGGMAVVSWDGRCAVEDMPVLSGGKDKMLDGHAIYAWIKQWEPTLIVIERVGAMPGQGVVSMFNFGVSYGTLLGIASALPARVALVSPVRWKKSYGLVGKDKDAARKVAHMRWPTARPLLMRKKDIGRADALLIAEYGLTLV